MTRHGSAPEIERAVERKLDEMVRTQIEARGLDDAAVCSAMRRVDRALFVPDLQRRSAYEDGPLPIGQGQTISQPYVVALMTSLMRIRKGMRILDIGVGSGYQSAVLSSMGAVVFGIERLFSLASAAAKRLSLIKPRIHLIVADGTLGWPSTGRQSLSFDGIMVGAASPQVPKPLIDQLDCGGRMLIPLGDKYSQTLTIVTKDNVGRMQLESAGGVRFVPLVGERGFSSS